MGSRKGQPSNRWRGVPVEERRAELRRMSEASSRNQRERKITELVKKWPPLTEAQRARLITLLNSGAGDGAEGRDSA